MDINLGHASIIDKKISSFARALMEIFNFFIGKPTLGPPCISSSPFVPFTENQEDFFLMRNKIMNQPTYRQS
jgi:hypothetical protein